MEIFVELKCRLIDKNKSIKTINNQEIGYAAVNDFIERAKAFKGEPFNPKQLLSFSTWTIMGHLMYGQGFEINDEEV